MREIIVEATSLTKAADYLNKYADKLEKRSADILKALLNEGEVEARKGLEDHIDTGVTIASVGSERKGLEGTVSVFGNNGIWLEFGTGTTYNSTPHPKAAELGMSAYGTYIWPFQESSPQRPHGADPGGWWYRGDDGETHHTYGIKATYFFTNTAKMLRRQYAKIAKGAYK